MNKFVYRGKDKKFAQRFASGGPLYSITPAQGGDGSYTAPGAGTNAANGGVFGGSTTGPTTTPPPTPAAPAPAPAAAPAPAPAAAPRQRRQAAAGGLSVSSSDGPNLNVLGRPGGL